MHQNRGAIMRGARHRNLELARQERELRMQARPLAEKLRGRPRIFDLVRRDAGEMIGRHIANAVARRLDGVHLDFRQRFQNVRRIDELGPIVLEVLARREMAVAFVPFIRDVGEPAHLPRRQRAIGNSDAQHIGVQLEIEPVHQPEGAELLFGQRAGKPPIDLLTKLRHAFADKGRVIFIVAIGGHRRIGPLRHTQIDRCHNAPSPACLPRSRRTLGPFTRIFSR